MAVNKPSKYDFAGWATKADLKCSDGRTIMKGAFAHSDGQIVPLVWQHLHNEPGNILGHAFLESKDGSIYAYGVFNETEAGLNAKKLVQHGDITRLSIYANQLVEKSKLVHSGTIREVSLVLAGANPGATIDNIAFAHADGSESYADDEAIIRTDLAFELFHEEVEAEEPEKDETPLEHAAGDPTVLEVWDSLDENQKNLIYAIASQIAEQNDTVQQSDEEGESLMHINVFDEGTQKKAPSMTKAQFLEIVSAAKTYGGSLKHAMEAFAAQTDDEALAHAVTYGIENVSYLFPDAKALRTTPDIVDRDQGWVGAWIARTDHVPFSRIKSTYADITLADARAKGYVTAATKKENFFAVMKRTTDPTTVYVKQKMDRDDVVDITDFSVVAWLKMIMDGKLKEEIARAALIGDGRDGADPDKIDETKIRPIYTDDDIYAHKILFADTDTDSDVVDGIMSSRTYYKGSGNPVLFTTSTWVTNMLLIKDTTGRRIYPTINDLKAAMRVSDIVEVEVMDGVSRDVTVPVAATYDLVGILVNPKDYTYGATAGGQTTMFDDFDIDVNQLKYLIEGRTSGALTKPKSAIVFEQVRAAG